MERAKTGEGGSSPGGRETRDVLLGDIEAVGRRLRVVHELGIESRLFADITFSFAVARV